MSCLEQHLTFEYKGVVDLVTEADRKSEALILQRIRSCWPGHNFIGEEGSRIESASEYRWYVDPLDGTTNFAHGFPFFCVSLALEYRGKRVAAVVYDPNRDELFAAELGKGAYLNGKEIHVSAVNHVAECLLATGFPSQKRHKCPDNSLYHHMAMRTHSVRRTGSGALDLCCVAAGRFDGFWELNLNPWDTAAGVLIVEEAGGRVSKFDNSPFEVSSRETLATNGMIHDEMVREFHDIFAGRAVDKLPGAVEYAKGCRSR